MARGYHGDDPSERDPAGRFKAMLGGKSDPGPGEFFKLKGKDLDEIESKGTGKQAAGAKREKARRAEKKGKGRARIASDARASRSATEKEAAMTPAEREKIKQRDSASSHHDAEGKPKPGGFTKMKTGKRVGGYQTRDREGKKVSRGGRDIEATVSKNTFEYNPSLMDRMSGPNIEPGRKVKIAKLHGAPGPGTMGQYHIADAETGEFLGMVTYGSLAKPGSVDRSGMVGGPDPKTLREAASKSTPATRAAAAKRDREAVEARGRMGRRAGEQESQLVRSAKQAAVSREKQKRKEAEADKATMRDKSLPVEERRKAFRRSNRRQAGGDDEKAREVAPANHPDPKEWAEFHERAMTGKAVSVDAMRGALAHAIRTGQETGPIEDALRAAAGKGRARIKKG